MILSNDKHQLHIEIDDNTFWKLVKLGAELKMHPEDYIEQVIITHVEHELDKQTTH
jgi:hypothetical protein